MNKFYDSRPSIDVSLSVLGTFLNSGTLFVVPTQTKQLLDFHNNHHEYFKLYNDEPNSFYLPNKWIPHCTIANRLSQDKLVEAFNYCSKNIDIVKAQISEIVLIKVGNESSESSGVSTIHSVKLRYTTK